MGDSDIKISDPSSFSNPSEAIVESMHINLNVDFDNHILSGFVNLVIKKVTENASQIVLDTDKLKIRKVFNKDDIADLEYKLDEPDEVFGSRLSIKLPPNDEKCSITIDYETDPSASGLQWLAPEQTAGKVHPYMFSQFQPIYCRSMIPCQDSPAVKSTYSASIRVPSELVVLMSALKDQEVVNHPDGKSLYRFCQPIPMPSYLIAIAIGNLRSREIGPRSQVWSEPECVDLAAFEFSETETMLAKAEEICGPYVWGKYDILLMPPSFPFGGMENPCLTFVTPTLLAGDRSLACVIAHEISHSWTGNLVTNRNFEHFWLNEGFTMFVERKICGRMEGEKVRQFSAINGLNDLREAIKEMGENNPFTKLVVDLKGVHPDDAFSSCPYEKGFTFLFYLETVVGGSDVFEPFLKVYLDHFKYKSIDTDDFISFFLEYFEKNDEVKKIDWKNWLYTTGMPPVIPEYDQSLVEPCTLLANKWTKWDGKSVESFSSDDLEMFSALQKQEFLAQLLLADTFPLAKVIFMEEIYKLNEVNNSEIRFRWLRLCLKAKWYDSVPMAIEFATKYGRMKFVRPLFRDLFSWDLTKDIALNTFKIHRKQMMHVTASMVAKDLHLEESQFQS